MSVGACNIFHSTTYGTSYSDYSHPNSLYLTQKALRGLLLGRKLDVEGVSSSSSDVHCRDFISSEVSTVLGVDILEFIGDAIFGRHCYTSEDDSTGAIDVHAILSDEVPSDFELFTHYDC